MKVLLINNFHYHRGGSETVYFNTRDLLLKNGFEVVNFSQASTENEPSPQNSYFIPIQNFLKVGLYQQILNFNKFLYSKQAADSLEALIKVERPHIAHLHNFYGGLTSSILPVLKKYNIPIVTTLHDYKLLCPVYTFLDSKNKICEKCLNGHYWHCVSNKCNKNSLPYSIVIALESYYRDYIYPPEVFFDKIICVSKFSLVKHTIREDIKDKLVHLYNFSPLLEEKKTTINNEGYFLYFGRLSREKGVSTLLKAIGQVGNIKLKIVGNGPLLEDLSTVSDDAKKNIEFLGFKSGEELFNIINKASFVIVPSEWYENNPMTIIESYFLGTPVIGAKIGGIPEIIVPGKTGFLFESGNVTSLVNLLKEVRLLNHEAYKNLGQSCIEFARSTFSSEKHLRELTNIYNSLVK